MRVERTSFPLQGGGVKRLSGRSAAIANVAAGLCVLFGVRFAAAQDQPAADPSQTEIDAFIRTQMREQRIPGLSLAVTIDNELIFTKGYGAANVELRSPALAESVYEVASLTKQFVAVAVLLLNQDGKLSLDDPVSRHLPEAPPAWEKITLRHLLTHTSGIPDYDDAGQPLDPRHDYTEDELVGRAAKLPTKFAPGLRWNYSNTAYVMLGVIVHRVSGMFYGEFLRARVFSRLHMGNTNVNRPDDLLPFRAAGYRLEAGLLKNQEFLAPTQCATGDGGLVSTVVDLAKWDAAIQSGALLPPEAWDQVFKPVTLNSGKSFPYGFGWFIREQAGRPYYEHSGHLQGFASHILRFPRARVSVVVLANLAQADPWEIAHGVASLIRPDLKPPADHPIEDGEPAVTDLLRRTLGSLRKGEMLREAFTEEGADAYNAEVLADYKERLGKLAAFGTFELVSRAEVGDQTEYRYWVYAGGVKWLLEVALDSDAGRIERLQFNPL